jgi:hypothetical protein
MHVITKKGDDPERKGVDLMFMCILLPHCLNFGKVQRQDATQSLCVSDSDVDLVATIESLQDSCGCSINRGVTGGVLLLDRSRIKQGVLVNV